MADHVIRIMGFFCGSTVRYLRVGIFECFLPHLLITMSFSDQHPYTMFIASGLRSPSLAKV